MSSTYTIGMASNLDSFADAPPPDGTPPRLFFYFLFITYDALPAPPTFVVSQITADKKSTRPSTGSLPSVLPVQQRTLFPQAAGNPTFSVVLQAEPLPGGLVRVEVELPGGARPPEDFDFAPPLNAGQVTLALRHDQPPRLSLAVNTTFVAPPAATGSFGSPGPAELKAVLAHIHHRLLDGPTGAWAGSDGSPQLPYSPSAPDSAEETWAKAITEMLIGAPYGLPSTLYSGASVQFSDNRVLLKYLDDADPGFPLCYECQHLVTMAAMTRGIFKVENVKDKQGHPARKLVQFTAGGGSSTTVKDLGGSFLEAASVPDIESAIKAGVTPGSSWVYNGAGDKDNVGAAHIGFALRVDAASLRVQTFDTGGLNVAQRETPLHAGSADDPWVTAKQRVPGPVGEAFFKGVCKLPPPPDLAASVARMRRARPLGIARLIVMRRVTGAPTAADLFYVSPLLRMHFDGSDSPCNLTYGAYQWSLRDHPGAAELMATWLFYTPRGALTRVMLDGSPQASGVSPRQLTLGQLLHGAGVTTAADHVLAGDVFGVADIASMADGTVRVVRRFDQHDNGNMKPTLRPALFDHQPWGTRGGTVALTDADLADLPYFQGG